MTFAVGLLTLALLVSVPLSAAESEQCRWVDAHGIEVTVHYEKDRDAYLRHSRVEMRNASGHDLWLSALFPGQRGYWYLHAGDSRIEPVADDDYVPPPPMEARPGSPTDPAPSSFRFSVWKAGESLTQSLSWEDYLLQSRQWKPGERYVVDHAFAGYFKLHREDKDASSEMFSLFDPKNACRLWMVEVRADPSK